MKAITILFYSLIFVCIFSCGNSVKKNYEIGLENVKNQDYEAAIGLFSEIISKDTTVYEVYQSRSFCYYSTKEYKKAIKDYEKAYLLNSNPQLNFNIGICKVNIGDFKGALENFNAFEKKNSEDKNLWLQKALCLNELKQYPMAIEYYEKAKIAFPDSIKILKNLGLCHFQISQYYGVIEVLKPYLDTIKNDQTCFEMIAFSCHELGQYENSKKYFDQMSVLGMERGENPQLLYVDNLLQIGQKQYNTKKFIAALQTFSEIITLDPVNKEAFFFRGLVQLHHEKRKEACEDFNLACKNGHSKAITLMKKNCKEYFD